MSLPDPDDPVAGEPARTLAICFAFPPYQATSGISAAKRIRAAGEPVDLIQNKMDRLNGKDPSLGLIADDLIRRREVLDTPSWFGGWLAVAGFCDKGLPVVQQWQQEQGPYQRVYSRAHFIASHYLAARVKATWPGLHWVAEFSDPLSRDIAGRVRHRPVTEGELLEQLRRDIESTGFAAPDSDNIFEWAERLVYALADEIIFTNEAQQDMMLGACADPAAVERARSISRVSPHPVPPPELYAARSPEYELDPHRRHLGYFGAFYTSRRADALLRALEALPVVDREGLRVHVFTPQPQVLVEQARRLGIDDVLRVAEHVPFTDMLALCRRMDALVVMDADRPAGVTRNPFLPSKWSDYAGSGTPVWGMVDEGSPLDQQDLAWRSPVGHVSAALQVLVSMARDPLPTRPQG